MGDVINGKFVFSLSEWNYIIERQDLMDFVVVLLNFHMRMGFNTMVQKVTLVILITLKLIVKEFMIPVYKEPKICSKCKLKRCNLLNCAKICIRIRK